MPVLRMGREVVHRIRARISPTYRYVTLFETHLLGENRSALLSFLSQERRRLAESRVSRTRSPLTSLERRIERDYSQFFSSFAEALQHRLAFQRLLRNDWRALLTHRGRLERKQLAIEWLETPALSSINPAASQSTTKATPLLRRRNAVVRLTRGLERNAQEAFVSSLRGKSVLVIGPAAVDSLDDSLLADFEVLALPNLHKGMWLESLIGKTSGHTVVTYLNHQIVSQVSRDGCPSTRVWDFVRTKSADDADTLRQVFGESVTNPSVIGAMKSPEDLLMTDYGPLMGPNMVYDLLHAEPTRVYLTGFTFFIQEGVAYKGSYESAGQTDAFQHDSLRTHEPFSNFLFLKNLYHFGAIEADRTTGTVLSLTAEQFAESLDRRFPPDKHRPLL